MNAGDLITLQNVKDWLNPNLAAGFPSGSDTLLSRMVTAVSRGVGSYLQRNLQPANYVDVRDGTGTRMMFMRNRPIISVSSLTIGTTAITARPQPGSYGFAFDGDAIYLDGGCSPFWRGIQNVSVSYRAGFQQSDTLTVPGSPYTIGAASLSRPWNSDQGVVYASTGVALTPVTVAPTVVGTYQVTFDATKTAAYVFDSADTGASVVITYGYTPEDIVQACIEWCGERYRARDRIGNTSQTLGQGQTTGYSQRDMSAAVATLLNPYRNVTPVT